MPTRVGIVLTPNGSDCKVLVGNEDVTESCTAINVSACVGEVSRVVLFLRAPVEIIGDAGQLHINPPEDA